MKNWTPQVATHTVRTWARRAIPAPGVGRTWLVVTVTAVVVSLLIYLTPLHHLNLVQPMTRDVDPAAEYALMRDHPSDYVFIDVRPKSVYDAGHAAGSISIPLPNLYDDWHQLPHRGKTIVLICGNGKAAGVAFGFLEYHGFLNAVRIKEGFKAWEAAGLPTEQS